MQAKTFEFVDYKLDLEKRILTFNYKVTFKGRPELLFTERIELGEGADFKNIPAELFDGLLSSLHLMLGISYFKSYLPPEIILNKPINKEQAEFFNTVYKKGLGEFCYRNRINPKRLAKFAYDENLSVKSFDFQRADRVLLGIGGGKDSVVAGEWLKEHKFEVDGFVVETEKGSEIVDSVIQVMGIGTIKLKRFLDPKLFGQLEGAYNGHIPVSAIFAFLGVLLAVLYDYKYVAVANAITSDFGNIKYKGEEINHSWSKSSEFESLFTDYVRNFITPDVSFFSPIRPFYELRVIKEFVQYRKYLPIFSSCNRSFKVNKERSSANWCGECDKCAFMFLAMAPFIDCAVLEQLFSKNLLQDESLMETYKNLLGFGKLKPFDCVGTFEESQAALYLIKDKYADSPIVGKYIGKIKHGEELVKMVMRTYAAPTQPPKFKFLGVKSALLLGYGMENKAAERYIKKHYPDMKIDIADQKDGSNYLEKQKEFDLIIRTPVIPMNLVKGNHTTVANIFFAKAKNRIVGVTGSKGKSTTSSLIYAILKEGGLPVRLVGNIGNPSLEVIDQLKKEEIIVYELSSYMLEDILYSPHIAVITSLFPEHMDHHGSVEKYFEAKKNILKYQKNSDYFIYNPESELLSEWARDSRARSISFEVKEYKTTLPGEHNQRNIAAAVEVAKIFGVRPDSITHGVETFCGLPHRLESAGEVDGVTFYDDAISTTPESTIEAIRSIKNVQTILLGGQDRGYDFKELEKLIHASGIKNVVLFPDSGKKMLKNKKNLNILQTSSMTEAVEWAYKNTEKGHAVLLSTASPSYSLWKDFKHKGEEFKVAVLRLTK